MSLALIPAEYVRRAFSLLICNAPNGMEAFLAYVARVYIGLTEFELIMGAVAFTPTAEGRRNGSIILSAGHDRQSFGYSILKSIYFLFFRKLFIRFTFNQSPRPIWHSFT